MEIKFSQISNSLGTRVLGQKIRLDIERSLRAGSLIVFNFEGVDYISHSFADECFGKLLLSWDLEDLKLRSTFKNISSKIKQVIVFTFKERMPQKITAGRY